MCKPMGDMNALAQQQQYMEAIGRAGEGYEKVWEIDLTSTTELKKALQLGSVGVWRGALATRTLV